MTSSDPAASGDDRRSGERRRYNRRTTALSEAGPPYYEAFNRMATAMEAMQQSLEALAEAVRRQRPPGGRRLPDPPPRPRAG